MNFALHFSHKYRTVVGPSAGPVVNFRENARNGAGDWGLWSWPKMGSYLNYKFQKFGTIPVEV